MNKYAHSKAINSVDHLKYITKLQNEKSSQLFSDLSTLDNTPRLTKANKLEPIDQTQLVGKLAELGALRKSVPKVPTELPSLVPKGVGLSPKVWGKSAKENEEIRSLSAQKGTKKSKFPNSFTHSITQEKHIRSNFVNQTNLLTEGLTPKLTPAKESSSFDSIVKVKLDSPYLSEDYNVPFGEHFPKESPKDKEKEIVPSDNAEQERPLSKKEQPKPIYAYLNVAYRYFIFGHRLNLDKFRSHILMIHRGLNYCKTLKAPTEKFILSKQITLSEQTTKKKTLLLDLDETLIHACFLREKPDAVLSFKGIGDPLTKQLPIKVRPHLKEFLERTSEVYEIVLFTAAINSYAKCVINYIDSERKYISAILSRENCMLTKSGSYVKDLRIIKNREMKDMILVDNLVHSFAYQIENGVPILEFLGDKKDEELKYLADYLIEAASYDDVREFNKQKLKLKEIGETKIEEVIRQLAKI